MKKTLNTFIFFGSILLIIYSSSIILFWEDKSFDEIEIQKSKENGVAFISGAVAKPGVYEISDSTRIIDLIEMAGGTTEDADLESININLNLAKRVFNEDHIQIHFMGEISNNVSFIPSNTNNTLISINTASLEELQELPSIGPSTAQKIVEGRPYTSVDDLLNVSGIGDTTVDKIRSFVVL